jgi:hypothetical protein
MTGQIELKHIFPLEVWCIVLKDLDIGNLQIHFKGTSC